MNVDVFFKKDISVNDINYLELLFTSAISIALAIFLAYLSNNYFIYNVFKGIAATRHYGDEDVWAHLFHTKRVGCVIVRDHKLGLCYFGFVESYSDDRENRELLLRKVRVCNNATGKLLYRLDRMYFSREEHELTIDIPDNRFYLPLKEERQKK